MSSILDKIAKVLAKAEASDNEHEADAFLAQAQKMATAHAIDLAVARRHTAKTQKREVPVQRTITIGMPRAIGNAKMVNLFLTIARANDVTCNIAHNSTYVIAFGFPSDIEVVEALYGHVAFQMVQAATAYLKSGEHREDYTWNPRTGTFGPPNAKSARLSFYEAFTYRIADRLERAREEAEAAAVVERDAQDGETGAGQAGTALVLADKRAEVKQFYKATSNARGSWRGNRTPTVSSASARRAGDSAGSRARLTAIPALPKGRPQVG